MRIYRNATEITRKETLGRRFSFTGLAILFVGLLASFVPTWYPPGVEAPNAFVAMLQDYWAPASFIALPAGFIFATLGSYYINRFARRRWPDSKTFARPDEVLERNMKGFDDKFAYFSHSLPGSNYVVTGPSGVLIFAVRSDKGRVRVEGDRWREPFSIGRFFTVFAREGVGDPNRELDDQTRKMRELLSKAGTSGEAGATEATGLINVPVEGAVVFLNSAMQLDVDSPKLPVLRVDQVKDYIRRKAKDTRLPTSTVRALNEYLRENSKYQEVEEKAT